MDKDKLITAFNASISHCSGLRSFQQNTDSMIKRITHHVLTVDEIINFQNSFINNYGRVGDGMKVRVPETDKYFRFTTDYMLMEDDYEEIKIMKASTRMSENKNSVILYVNGKKVPDSRSYLYCAESSTDIMIPEEYIDTTKDNIVVVEMRIYNEYLYAGGYVKSFSGDEYTLDLINNSTKIKIDSNTVMVFVDRMLIPNIIYSIVKVTDTSYRIIFDQTYANSELEVFVDSSAIGVFRETIVNSQVATFTVDETYVDPLYGPISRDVSMYFCNGLRVSNFLVEAAGRMNFEYHFPVMQESIETIMVYTDLGIINNTGTKFYGDDYFLYNMIGSTKVKDGLKNNNSGSIFDGKVDFDQVMNQNGLKYNREEINNLLKQVELRVTYAEKIQYLIDQRPELLRTFLEQFGEKRYYYNIVFDINNPGDMDEPVLITTPKIVESDKIVFLATHVNGNYISAAMSQVSDIYDLYSIEVPKSMLVDGNNTVEIVEYVSEQTQYYYRLSDVESYDNIGVTNYRLTSNVFGNINDKDDIIILVPTSKNTPEGSELVYTNPSGFGFRKLDPSEFMAEISETEIIVDFGANKPFDKVIIASSKYSGYHSLVFTEKITYETMITSIHMGTVIINFDGVDTEFEVPIVHNGSIVGYTRDTRMFEGVDFMYRSQGTHDVMGSSGLIIKRQFDIGDRMDFFFLPYKQTILKYKEDTSDNTFGLVYMSEGSYPFSPKYINVYANGKKLNASDIDILSGGLIRIPRLRQSFQDLYIETSFSIDIKELQDYIDLYEVSDFEKVIADIFKGVDYKAAGNLGSMDIVNNAYLSFVDGVDSVNKLPNPLRLVHYLVTRFDPYINAYILWKASTDVRAYLNPLESIPQSQLEKFEIYYNGIESNRRDVVIDPSKRVLFSDVHFTIDTYPALHPDMATRMVLEWMKEEGLSTWEAINRYKDAKINNDYYMEDMVQISPLNSLDIIEDIIVGEV